MDFTFLFIVILMLLAIKSELNIVAFGLFALLLFTAKSKYLIIAALVGLALILAVGYLNLGDYQMPAIVGALFVVVLLIAKKESDQPAGGAYGGGGGGMFG
ncbi:hypothetical protein COU39_00425 [Candidatus Micrarchaeota archaeon CG10_big_fil_rev_8_21_14_0_10_60_32]|nr:MAG: hypothetical protein COU39_00425 [Candidatus Micrarchaeota archaeon CG10_big_fil_rev_8_21_14_0_10_60_32]PIO01652.1 MAG: hypothetical protein COT58_04080 [Candidatus Micrarchaeota archaeon CG09_land_8_20_14_0_10_60_16]